MSTDFFQGGIFKIAAVHSDKVLDVPSEKKLEDVQLQQWVADSGGFENQRENQLFVVFPADDVGKYFSIASWCSGKVLDVSGRSVDEGAAVIQCTFSGQDNQLFELEEQSQPNTYLIRAKHSGKPLTVAGGQEHADGAKIVQSKTFPNSDYNFRFEKMGELRDMVKIRSILGQESVPSPSEFPALSSPQKPQNVREWKLTGKPFLIPYFMIGNDNNPLWQIRNSPYYLLTREVCYTLNDEYFTYNHTSSEQEYEVIVTSGFTTEEAKSFTKNTGLEISSTFEQKVGAKAGAEVEYGLGKANAEVSTETSLSFTASASLSLGYSTSASLSRHNETQVRRLVKCPPSTSVAVWNQTSKFTLSRLDKSILKSWEVLEGGIFIDDFNIPQDG